MLGRGLVPCHRVVPAGTPLGGGAPGQYRWGAERKRALLARERQAGEPPLNAVA
ncbi:MAG TPA: MGMT family protein [Gemmatirosa sp.]